MNVTTTTTCVHCGAPTTERTTGALIEPAHAACVERVAGEAAAYAQGVEDALSGVWSAEQEAWLAGALDLEPDPDAEVVDLSHPEGRTTDPSTGLLWGERRWLS